MIGRDERALDKNIEMRIIDVWLAVSLPINQRPSPIKVAKEFIKSVGESIETQVAEQLSDLPVLEARS